MQVRKDTWECVRGTMWFGKDMWVCIRDAVRVREVVCRW